MRPEPARSVEAARVRFTLSRSTPPRCARWGSKPCSRSLFARWLSDQFEPRPESRECSRLAHGQTAATAAALPLFHQERKIHHGEAEHTAYAELDGAHLSSQTQVSPARSRAFTRWRAGAPAHVSSLRVHHLALALRGPGPRETELLPCARSSSVCAFSNFFGFTTRQSTPSPMLKVRSISSCGIVAQHLQEMLEDRAACGQLPSLDHGRHARRGGRTRGRFSVTPPRCDGGPKVAEIPSASRSNLLLQGGPVALVGTHQFCCRLCSDLADVGFRRILRHFEQQLAAGAYPLVSACRSKGRPSTMIADLDRLAGDDRFFLQPSP